MKSMKVVAVLALTVMVGGAVAFTEGEGSPRPAIASSDVSPDIPPAGAELARARGAVTFDILMPQYIPDGAELLNVVYSAPGLGQPSSAEASNVDIWYLLEDGRRVHIWMSDADLASEGELPQDDSRSSPVTLENGIWHEFVLRGWNPPSTVLAREIGGVNIQVDVQGDSTELVKMAASFPVPSQSSQQ